MLSIGFVEYINALPFSTAFLQGHLKSNAHFIFGVPSQVNSLLKKGEIDIGLVSSAEYLDDQNHQYELLPGLGIFAQKKILSVNLYVKENITDLSQSRIGVTYHSATSFSLLKVLCHHFWKVTPNFELLPSSYQNKDYEGLLLIGDAALKQTHIEGFRTVDLAEAWHQFTHLPFVFAVFAIRKESLIRKKREILDFHNQLELSLEWAEKNMQTIEDVALKKSSLCKNLISDYYKLCKYRLSQVEMKALNLFSELRLGL